MSSVWYYEPFYDLDRFLDETLGRWDSVGQRPSRRLDSGENAGGAVRAIKPRYVTGIIIGLTTITLTICLQNGPSRELG
jgi:hypothetical protein